MTHETQRVHPFFRSTLIILLVVLVPYVAWSSWDYYEARALDAVMSEARARTSADSTPATPRIQFADDPLRFYAAATALIPYRPDLQILDRTFRDILDRPPSAEDIAAAEAILRESGPVFELVSRAKSAPQRDWRATATVQGLSPLMNNVWMLFRILSFRTHVLARTARWSAATESLIDQVSILRFLQTVEPAGPGRFYRRLALDISGSDLEWLLRQAPLESHVIEALQRTFGGAGDGSSDWDPGFPIWLDRQFNSREMNTLTRPLIRRRIRQLVSLSLEIDEISRRPWPERLRQLEALEASARDTPLTPLPTTAKRSVSRSLESAQMLAITLVRARAIAVVLAVERYRLDSKRLPATLAELSPGYLERVPIDPFTGQPLRYRADPDGYRVYGIGANGKDDGGDFGWWSGLDASSQRYAPDVGVRITR